MGWQPRAGEKLNWTNCSVEGVMMTVGKSLQPLLATSEMIFAGGLLPLASLVQEKVILPDIVSRTQCTLHRKTSSPYTQY